ncbi:MAG: 50S ribosomal protein L21 [Ignavibacteriales bacterium]|nr:50S ribosomal protein L21 [Ignavibacteriales bacterium]
MFAVVDIAGSQVKLTTSEKLFVPKLKVDVGAKVKFDKVILRADDTKTTVGSPYISGAYVEAKVIRHLKDDKVRVFKKKKRKGYKVSRGHRQQYTEIEVTHLA